MFFQANDAYGFSNGDIFKEWWYNQLDALSGMEYLILTIKLHAGSVESMTRKSALIQCLRVVQRGVHFTFEFDLGERRIRHSPTRKLNDVIFNRFWVDLDMSHHEISITSQRIELPNFGSELPSGLPLTWSEKCFMGFPLFIYLWCIAYGCRETWGRLF